MIRKLSFTLLGALLLQASAFGAMVVTNTNDSGPGSLRQAIQDAPSGDTITFDLPPGSTITLTSGELLIARNLVISGPGSANLQVERFHTAPGAPNFRIFHVGPGTLDVTIADLTIAWGNASGGTNQSTGGGLHNESIGQVELRKSVVTKSGALNSGGGISNTGSLSVVDTTVTDNFVGTSFSDGGGISNTGTLTLLRSCVSRNRSDNAVGISNGGTLNVINSTISSNKAAGSKSFGGGISTTGKVVMIKSTLAENLANIAGSGILLNNNASVEIGNSLVDNAISGTGTVTSLGYNLFTRTPGGTFTPGPADQIGTNESPIDAKLGPLQNNGGPSETHALLPGSPAIDKGSAVPNVTTDQRGKPRPVDDRTIAPAAGGDNSDIGAFEAQRAQALNLSTRLRVLTGDHILIAGFIVVGNEPKKILIRGIGPTLANYGVQDPLTDPVLQLFQSSTLLAVNDNWKDEQQAEIEATGIPPGDQLESAIVRTLDPGNYTAVLFGKADRVGVGLVEVYDLAAASNSTFGNLSTRGFVGTSDNVMIGGFILGAENASARILLRGIGPSLQGSGINDALLDPVLELRDGNGALIAQNDDWRQSQQAEIEATGIPPKDDRESAILRALGPGAYTAVLSGKNGTTGVALVELYRVN
jgi:hypothetical protein